jgi:hypothetical protein
LAYPIVECEVRGNLAVGATTVPERSEWEGTPTPSRETTKPCRVLTFLICKPFLAKGRESPHSLCAFFH